VVKALRAVNFHVLTERSGLDGFLRQGGGSTDTAAVLGWLVFWLAILTALMIAFKQHRSVLRDRPHRPGRACSCRA